MGGVVHRLGLQHGQAQSFHLGDVPLAAVPQQRTASRAALRVGEPPHVLQHSDAPGQGRGVVRTHVGHPPRPVQSLLIAPAWSGCPVQFRVLAKASRMITLSGKVARSRSPASRASSQRCVRCRAATHQVLGPSSPVARSTAPEMCQRLGGAVALQRYASTVDGVLLIAASTVALVVALVRLRVIGPRSISALALAAWTISLVRQGGLSPCAPANRRTRPRPRPPGRDHWSAPRHWRLRCRPAAAPPATA